MIYYSRNSWVLLRSLIRSKIDPKLLTRLQPAIALSEIYDQGLISFGITNTGKMESGEKYIPYM